MEAALKPYATSNVARYTSYPTAREFSSGVGAGEVNHWLSCVGSDEEISLYLHIPFCEKICWYCACATTAPNGHARVADYVQSVKAEIGLWAARLGGNGRVSRIHFGGGSPNMLACGELSSIMQGIHDAFNVCPDADIAMELDPRTLTEDFIDTMSAVGVTRASLGVQTLAPLVQEKINRIQPRQQITKAVSHMRKSGIKQVSFDLMYGLPGQTVEDCVEAAEYAAMIGVNRLSVFGYAHVPWFVSRQRAIDDASLPGVEARYDQVRAFDDVLLSKGFAGIGFDHYALADDSISRAQKNGTLRRNFQGFTDDPCQTLIGIGESSISSFRQGYAQNEKKRPDWLSAISDGQLPVARGYELSPDDRLRSEIIELLLCYLEVDVETVCACHNTPIGKVSDCLSALEPLQRDGLCELDGGLVRIPRNRKFFARQVAAKFDSFVMDAGQHAVAV